jgi:DNA-binding NtrC family response regulator
MARILIVDDDGETCRFMAELLERPGRELRATQRVDEALRLAREQFDLLISDINLDAQQNGMDVLRAFKDGNPSGQVVLNQRVRHAPDRNRGGPRRRLRLHQQAVQHFRGQGDGRTRARATPPAPARIERPRFDVAPPGLIGRTAGMLAVYKQIAHAANATAPVLIAGESGTGKELVARAIHTNGRRSARAFVYRSIAARSPKRCSSRSCSVTRVEPSPVRWPIPRASSNKPLAAPCFSTRSARRRRPLQVKLLRVLQEGEVRPVGASRIVKVDVRVVAATQRGSRTRGSAQQRFRQDLFYRLSVIVIQVPALRDRREDIPLLIETFLESACSRAGRRVELTPAAIAALTTYRWPGNVRELENTIERLVVFSRGSIVDLPDLPFKASAGPDLHERLFADLPSLDEIERRYLLHVIEQVGGNRTRAAEVLGIDRRTLYRMAERFGIDLTDEKPSST